ncbi:MAG: biotin--[acetyl-CoA-carboxylase] ligase [Chloroflexota bacterium]
MDLTQRALEVALADLPLGPLRYFDCLGSTNSEAASWADAGAPDLSLVLADEQSAGRGRQGRQWFTPPGAALAFSLVLRQPLGLAVQAAPDLPAGMARLTALGAVAVNQALRLSYQLPARVKWPNDVLLDGRKAAGILAEAHWQGDRLEAVILGIGVNVCAAAVPAEAGLIFPATSVETALGRPVERLELLHAILVQLLDWRQRLWEPIFLHTWEGRLAFKGEWVQMIFNDAQGAAQARLGLVLGLDAQGCLRLRDQAGEIFSVCTGEVRLRPADERG